MGVEALPYGAEVERGAKLLDEVEPGWHRRVAMDRLAMKSCSDCVLGQLYGSFWTALISKKADVPFAVSHGFVFDGPESSNYDQLAETWRAAIRERLEKDKEV